MSPGAGDDAERHDQVEREAYKRGWDDRAEMQKVVGRGSYPALFALFWPLMRETARAHGYALALHGSLARDMDVLAVPWVQEASSPRDLVAALAAMVGGVTVNGLLPDAPPAQAQKKVEEKPHGRLGYVLHLPGGAYIDLSVMQPST